MRGELIASLFTWKLFAPHRLPSCVEFLPHYEIRRNHSQGEPPTRFGISPSHLILALALAIPSQHTCFIVPDSLTTSDSSAFGTSICTRGRQTKAEYHSVLPIPLSITRCLTTRRARTGCASLPSSSRPSQKRFVSLHYPPPYIVLRRSQVAIQANRRYARPQTRITTSYHVKPARRKSKKDDTAGTGADAAAQKPPRGHLVLKTFDPHSGVCLKYKTSKAAEVSRLVQMLGTLGRRMAALPAAAGQDEPMADAPAADAEAAAPESGAQTPVPAPVQGQQPRGGKGKKKKGKR